MAGQIWATASLGSIMAQPYLTERLRHVAQPIYRWRQFVDVKEAIGRNRGEKFLFDKSGNVSTPGGTLVETATMPQTQFATTQGTAVITEYGKLGNYIHRVRV